MGVVERVFGWLVTVLLLASFTVSGAFATPPDIGDPKATILGYIAEPVKIGETQLIPIDIGYMPKFKYGIIKFNKISPSVDIDDIILDPNQKYPHRIYVPVTVTGEGLFDIKGNITVEALDGEKFTN
ncbi:MAG: hypothetical protein LBC08_00785, partial [Campylobacteraceae bacterium]|nr:hypothetical protein [Campylobacteraceae bacterium]